VTYASVVDDPFLLAAAIVAGAADGVAVDTSGSTGDPRTALIGAPALLASAEATHRRLGGPGAWLLALPVDRIAGFQVLVRAELSGIPPARMPDRSFAPDGFVDAVARLRAGAPPGARLYCSLVPTQLRRLRADAAGAAALAAFDAVLVGGAPLGRDARERGVLETYGSTETAGGCVYDGHPLPGVRVDVDADERIIIAGPVLFDGYADGGDDGTMMRDGTRWLRMPDLGRMVDGQLVVDGRADDVMVTGGHKVHPTAIEGALRDTPGLADAVAVPIPDDEWGERIVALVVGQPGYVLDVRALREELVATLPRHAVPKEVRVVESLPLLESGKIDRGAARALAQATTGGARARDDA